MRGFNPGSRRVFASGGYLFPVIGVLVIAVTLVVLLLAYMPLTDTTATDTNTTVSEIIGISYPDGEIGLGADLSNVVVNVVYKDGTVKEVPISDMVNEGLNVTKTGTQNVVLSYGGFEQTIPITVRDVSCKVTYEASVGGYIQGESVQNVKSGQDAGRVVAVPETGYVFSEWNDGYPYASRKDTSVNSDCRFRANFEKEKFRVIFYYYDGTVAREVDVLYGQAVTDIPKMTDPKMKVYGYTFEGWSVAESDYTHVYRNLNIYPQYTKTATDVDLTVSVDQYGNNMGITDVNECGYYANDAYASLTATPYNSREFNCWYIYGYYYDEVKTEWTEGWATLAKQGTAGESTLDIYIGDKRILCTFTANAESNSGTNFKLTFMPKEGMELIRIKAEFVYTKSTVTFINYQNAKKGNQELTIADVPFGTTVREALEEKSSSEIISLDGDGMLLPADLATTYGMEFMGWYDKNDENQALITTEKTFKEPTTLIAQWKKLTYEVIFDYSTSEVIYSYSTYVEFQNTLGSGSNGGIPLLTPYLNKYNFIGWEDALTGEAMDDTSQIIAKTAYIEQRNEDNSNNFIDNKRIYIRPRWQEKEHTLTVSMSGMGSVMLEITPAVGNVYTAQISGSYTLKETSLYKITFFAGEGNAVSRYEWKHGSLLESYVETQQTDKITASVFENVDNEFSVTFEPKKFSVTIVNGDDKYTGFVKEQDTLHVNSNEKRITATIDYSTSLGFSLTAPDTAYSISSLLLTGTVNGTKYDNRALITSPLSSYTLLLENITSDITLTIGYSAIKFSISVNQPRDGSGTPNTGTVKQTTINGNTASENLSASNEYTPGEYIFYEMESEDGKYISSVTFNGQQYDIFGTANNNVVFYDWEINGEYYGVGLKKIDGMYYYYYGSLEYSGDIYFYCTKVTSGEEAIFLVEDEANEKYTLLQRDSGAQNSAPTVTYDEIAEFLIEGLNVLKKIPGRSDVTKDLRITKVRVMILVQKDVSISIITDKMTYTVTAEKSEYGTVGLYKREGAETFDLDNPCVSSFGADTEVLVKARPIDGYSLVGYTLNGVKHDITLPQGLTYTLELSNIESDQTVSFLYEPVTYAVVFIASTQGDCYVQRAGDGLQLLSRSVSFGDCVYAQSYSFTLSSVTGKVITAIKVNNVSVPVTYNMKEYTYVCTTLTEEVLVQVECGAENMGNEPAGENYLMAVAESMRYISSVRYDTSTEITLVAQTGYRFSTLTLRGKQSEADKMVVINNITPSGYTVSESGYFDTVTAIDGNYQKGLVLSLPITLFDDNTTAQLSVVTEAEIYAVTLSESCSQNGIVTCDSTNKYGSTETISISASTYYYIEYFKINDVVISFTTDSRWSSVPLYDTSVGEYTAGTFLYPVTGPVYIDVGFARFTYKVSVDGDSKNGTTLLSSGSNKGTACNVSQGSSLTVSMQANEGYHIKSATIVGEEEPFYKPSSLQSANTVREATAILENVEKGFKVLVEYEINRYNFTYEIINASENFSGTSGAGYLTCDYTLGENNKYSGIAHGDNFCLNITPSASTGYYLYSVAVTYKGYNDNAVQTRTKYYTDNNGIVLKTGGSIWFNRFWFNSDEQVTGVTADIEKIAVTFKRESYTVSFRQETEGGNLAVAFSNSNASASETDVVLFARRSGSSDEYSLLYYNMEENLYKTMTPSGKVDSGVHFTYRVGSTGELIFVKSGEEYEVRFEYGLRCTVTVQPNEGYTRETFAVNGEARDAFVVSDKYSFNIYRDSDVTVSYRILTYTVGITAVIYDNENKKDIGATKASEYISVVMTVYSKTGVATSYFFNNTLSLSQTVEYGSKVTFSVTSLFNGKGVYLNNLLKTTTIGESTQTQQVVLTGMPSAHVMGTPVWGNVEGTVGYGFRNELIDDSIMIDGNFSLNAYFQLREYSVSTSITYDEDIRGESANTVRRESTNTDSWTVYWGTNTSVKIDIAKDIENNIDYGYGYDLKKIIISERTADGRVIKVYDLVPSMDGSEVSIVGDYFTARYLENETDPVYGTRNVLYLEKVKYGLTVEVQLSRKTYTAFFTATDTNGLAFIEKVETAYNTYNNAYPQKTVDSSTSSTPWEIQVRHYDELQVTITPKDGYKLNNATIRVISLVWNEQTDEWVEGGVTAFTYNTMGAKDIKYFTFHPSGSVAQTHIRGNVRILIDISIKTYKLSTTVIRTDSSYDTSIEKNNTSVQLTTYDRQVNGIVLSQPSPFMKGSVIPTADAVHFGKIVYEFTTPEGYRLSLLKANGLSLEELEDKGLLIKKQITRNTSNENCYDYVIEIAVTTDLITGQNVTSKLYDISVTLQFSVIEYNVVVEINGISKGFSSYNGRDGASDGKTITVYTSQKVTHFSGLIVEPVLYTGYEIPEISLANPNGSTSVTIGTSNNDSSLPADYGELQKNIRSRVSLAMNCEKLTKADLSKEYTTIYLHFKTSIIYYDLVLDSMAYYSKNGNIEQTALKNNTSAGTVTYSLKNDVMTGNNGYNKEDKFTGSDSTFGTLNGSYPYFTKVSVEASALTGFAVYDIYELVEKNGQTVWESIVDGKNGITYSSKTVGTKVVYSFSYEVNNVGNKAFTVNKISKYGRQFRIDIKQKTEVTVVIPNPYRYILSENNHYQNYYELMAFESDDAHKSGTAISPSYVPTYSVKDQYKFEVYVGNYFSILFTDLYRGETCNISVYNKDLSDVATDLISNEKCYDTVDSIYVFNQEKYETQYDLSIKNYLKDKVPYGGNSNGERHQIIGKETFYIYNDDSFSHVQTTKTTYGAVKSVGGSVYYNETTSEKQNNIIYEDEAGSTRSGRIMTIVCQAKENYEFYRLRFRKINKTSSQNAGYIVFDTTNANAWQTLTFTQTVTGIPGRSSSVTAFNANNTNDYVLINYRTEEETTIRGTFTNYIFTVWMNGDMELEAEFYRTYEVTYGIWLSDYQSTGTAITVNNIEATDIKDTVFSKPFANAKLQGTSSTKISYNSEFKLTVPEQDENYVFVGWYVNDVNTFTRLAQILPDEEMYAKSFIANLENMKGLQTADGDEVTDIVIYARFEPTINIQLLNEKYYALDSHFNSWSMGSLQARYYDFSGSYISGTESAVTVTDNRGKSITDALAELDNAEKNKVKAYDDANKWSKLYTDSVVSGYSASMKQNIVYTSYRYITTLHENITESDFVNNTWQHSTLELHLSGMGSDVEFSSWQYYNWNTDSWEEIGYTYADESYGITSTGGYYYVTNTSKDYLFSLDYLYQKKVVNGETTWLMPYAISSENENNLGGNRPLLIRANTYKKVTVTLQQYAFSNDYSLGLDGIDKTALRSSVVSPCITDEYEIYDELYENRNAVDASNISGEFEYGAKINIMYDAENIGSEIIYNGIRYRFIGWFISLNDKMYLLEESDQNISSAFGYSLICAPGKSDTTIYLNAYYVAQYKQTFQSKGISGTGKVSNDSAPKMVLTTSGTTQKIELLCANMIDGMVQYNGSEVVKSTQYNYMMASSSADYSKLSTDGVNFSTSPALSVDVYLDAGLEYTITVAKSTAVSATEDIRKNGKQNNGFNPEFDTLYQLKEDNVITQDFSSFYNTGNGTYYVAGEQKSANYLTNRALHCMADNLRYHVQSAKPSNWATTYRTYYLYKNGEYVLNTAKEWNNEQTYYYMDDAKLVGWNNGVKNYSATATKRVEISYVTTAVLVFYNVMYSSGVTLTNSTFIKKLTGQSQSQYTIWDDAKYNEDGDMIYNNARYGDWIANGEGITPLNNANGEVVIRITLQNMSGNGYASVVKYALSGMHSGNGITSVNKVADASGNLFLPNSPSYSRWTEIDLNSGYYFKLTESCPISTTLLFGKGINETLSRDGMSVTQVGVHEYTPKQFSIDYCGNGTRNHPYIVYYYQITGSGLNNKYYTDNTQLKFINTFWQYNEYSCCDWEEELNEDTGEYEKIPGTVRPNYFKLADNGILTNDSTSLAVNLTDLDLSDLATNNGRSGAPRGNRTVWTPLCSAITDKYGNAIDGDSPKDKKGFDGVFDGSGVKIVGLDLDSSAGYNNPYYGLFGKIIGYDKQGSGENSPGSVKNLKFDNVYVFTGSAVQYASALCAYAYEGYFKNITFTTAKSTQNRNLYTGSTFNNTVYGAQIYIVVLNVNDAMAGAVMAYGKNCVVENITLDMGPDCAVETFASGYCGGLIGAMEGGSITNVKVEGNSGYIVSDSLIVSFNGSGASGGLFGMLSGSSTESLTFTELDISVQQSFIVGGDNSNISGGIFGIIGENATIHKIKHIYYYTGDYEFNADIYEGTTTRGTIVQALSASKSEASVGRAVSDYGFAGGIVGVNYGILSEEELDPNGYAVSFRSEGNNDVRGYIHTYSGIAGGIAGGNFGMVANFTLASDFRLVAWEPYTSTAASFNYGVLVGYNFSGKAEGRGVEDGVVSSTSNFVATGLINDCVLLGAGNNADYDGDEGVMPSTVWNTASLYVFYRDYMSDSIASITYPFLKKNTQAETSSAYYSHVSSASSYVNSQNYCMMGGICGYSAGRIYNSGTKGIRLSTYRYRYAQKDSSAFGSYAWAVEAGFICGYFDPQDTNIKGWDSYLGDPDVMMSGNNGFDITQFEYSKDLNTNRIQSCYAYGCSAIVSYTMWMDGIYDAEVENEYCCASGISLGGITGGSGTNNKTAYGINNCYSKNNQFYTSVNAFGSSAKEDSQTAKGKGAGWAFWTTTDKQGLWGSSTKTFYHSRCIRPFCNVEVEISATSGGLTYAGKGGERNSNSANYCFFANNNVTGYTTKTSVSDTYQNLGSDQKTLWLFGGDNGANDLANGWKRFIRYGGETRGTGFPNNMFTSQEQGTLVNSMGGMMRNPAELGKTGYAFGFYLESLTETSTEYGIQYSADNAEIIKTDYQTGALFICADLTACVYEESGRWYYKLRDEVTPSRAGRVVRGITLAN